MRIEVLGLRFKVDAFQCNAADWLKVHCCGLKVPGWGLQSQGVEACRGHETGYGMIVGKCRFSGHVLLGYYKPSAIL